MTEAFWIQIAVAVPATIAALAAWRNARGANKAVNNRPSGEPKLLEVVLDIQRSAIDTNDRVTKINGHIQDHLIWHGEHDLQTREQVEGMIHTYDEGHPHRDV